MKNIVITILSVLCFTTSVVSQELINQKYLVSLIKMETDNKLNKEIKSFFKIKRSKKTSTLFQVSSEISFIDIEVFKDELKEHKNILPFDFELLEAKEEFKSKYSYEAIKNDFQDLLPSGDEYLFIHFSKPIGNLLTLQLSNHDLNSLPIKYGKVMQILFLFDEKGLVKNIYTKTFLYN
ncbi:hypothetical protein [Aureivirga sp. CE67]|uniref:hypothetical protein n=1 Tax=Aureivirga sp. CE67 TaxID=1788983 RepID=UPI0018CA2F0C|nr:hypothetical protein [Aureivirga sp. CE67]